MNTDKQPSSEMSPADKMSQDRGAQYGDFSKMAALAQQLKRTLVTAEMSVVQQEAMQMICTKLARIANGNCHNVDSWADIAGYANLAVRDLSDPTWMLPPKTTRES